MSFTVKANTLAITPNVSTYFAGNGGSAPYSYLVLPGGAGGTIDSTSGRYTAPRTINQDDPSKSYDTILAVDSNSANATTKILVATPLELVCDIIRSELELAENQVYLWDQKINIPKDSALYVSVGVSSCKPFGNSISYDSAGEAIQSVNMLARIDINIMSRGPAARDRKEEVVLALASVYSRQQQELNSFLIGKLPTAFINLSQEDGAAIPYRFNISVNVQYSFTKTKTIPYIDSFSNAQVITES